MPSRRSLLQNTTAGATILFAGCLSSGANETTTPNTDTATPPRWHVKEPVEMVTVGTPERRSPDESPRYRHQIRVWNRLSEEREVTVELAGPEQTRVDETVAIPVNEQFGIKIFEKATYELSVDLLGSETAESFDVPKSVVDCNYSVDVVAFYGQSRSSVKSRSTSLDCNDDE